jgi:GTPase SAR1 family protein
VLKIRDNLEVHLWDSGGQISERRKWRKLYDENFDYILFVVNIADYNRKMYETDSGNRLIDSIELFSDVLSTEAFQSVPILLIFNKIDLFKEKIMNLGDFNTYFPDYKGASNDTQAIRAFIKEMFMERLCKVGHNRMAELLPIDMNAIDAIRVKNLIDTFVDT